MKYDLTAIGNALVDTQFKVTHKLIDELGLVIDQMNLSSADEQAPIIERLRAENAESVSDCGGSATNTLVAAASFGAKCSLACVVANDKDGEMYISNLNNIGIDLSGNIRTSFEEPTGKCLILVTPDAKRTMTTALNISSNLKEEDIDYKNLLNTNMFYIEGYVVTSDYNFNSTLKMLEKCNVDKVPKKALSLSDPGVVQGFKDRFFEIESYGLDYIFCNEDEALAFSNVSSLNESIKYFGKKPYITVITKGDRGCTIINQEQIIEINSEKIKPVDTNGAGDMFAGCFLYALSQGSSLQYCGEFANYGAAKLVEKFGPRLDKDGYAQVLKKFKKN